MDGPQACVRYHVDMLRRVDVCRNRMLGEDGDVGEVAALEWTWTLASLLLAQYRRGEPCSDRNSWNTARKTQCLSWSLLYP